MQSYDPEHGLFLHLPHLPKGKGKTHIRKLKERSIFYQGVRIFNSLPKELRMAKKTDSPKIPTSTSLAPPADNQATTAEDVPPIDKYKSALDTYLLSLPDQPTLPNLTRSAPSNSIIGQKTYRKHTPQVNTTPKQNPRKRPISSQNETAAHKHP